MKSSLNKLNLWQKKRNELPIKDEPQNDWLAMQSLLDLHLPSVPVVPKKVPASSKVLKVVKALKAIKGSSLLFTTLTAAACASLVIYSVHKKHQQHTKIEHKKHKEIKSNGNLSNTLIIDSLNLTDSISNKKDSLSALNSPTTGKDTAIVIQHRTSPTVKNNINNKNLVVVTNSVNQTIAGSNNKKHPALISYNNQKAMQNAVIANGYAKTNTALLLQGVNPGSQLNIMTGLVNFPFNGGVVITPTNGDGHQSLINSIDSVQKNNDKYIIQPSQTSFLNSGTITGQNTVGINKNTGKTNKQAAARFKGPQKFKKEKPTSNSNNLLPSDLDWGILIGVNSSGSFTPKDQNANIYGNLPVDIYLGLFATYHFNDKWSVNTQIRVLNPQNLNSSFSHTVDVNESKKDSAKVLAITDSRKAYFLSIPIYLVYKINNNISLKGGPVINIPVKQITNSTSLQPGLKLDTAYNIKVSNQLKAIKYDQKINLGISGGVSLQYKRLILEATYLKSLSSYNVISDFGNYKSNKGTVQITIGLQLNRIKL
ncbi:Outer membrane protein beta-barrel domain-containing protein [Mucilaginibacter sp. OK268]|uniref:outer membrane beta-barrel protein n=1 Tax=Mucilaginibacter sp. OK268 TaxID=1881048 RepID=UPI0008812266|nr:outer membrane beta-barrel protein [Mucilaginibacter sp. OK268]SDP71789.1 Outer membrane protein beta-barrel domain-containing protein [Mucilaginibacter sp. OK268]